MKLSALSASVLFCLFFGLQVVLQSQMLRADIPPMQLLFFVYLTCFLLLTAVFVLVRPAVFRARLPTGAGTMFLLQTMLWILADIGVFLGLSVSAPVNYSILSRLQLFITYIGAVLFFRELFSGRKLAALLIAFAGTVLTVYRGQALVFGAGDLLFLAATLSISVSGLLRQRVSAGISSLAFTYWMFGVAVVVLGGIVFLFLPPAALPPVLPVLAISALAISGFTMVNYAIRHGGAAQFSLVASLLPFVTAVFAYILLHETPSVQQILGGAIIISGIVLFVYNPKTHGTKKT